MGLELEWLLRLMGPVLRQRKNAGIADQAAWL